MKGEVLRYARLCSNENDFIEKKNSFIEKLLSRNYSPEGITAATDGIDYKQRMTHLSVIKGKSAPPLV